jgi:two-component system, NarL family, sensor histidine kinase DesK
MMVNMRLTSRSEPGPEPEPGPSIDDDLDTDVTGLLRYRRLVIRVLLVIFLLLPAVLLLTSHQKSGHPGFLVLATLGFVVLTDRTVLIRMPEPGRYGRWQVWLLPLLVVLGAALFAVGGMAWLTALAVASAAVGRISQDGRTTVIGLVCCTAIAVIISAATGLGYSNTIVAGAVVALGNLLAHSAERRNVLMYRLKETRAELARAAVAEERLRISRDLHDLLGHSLSLITLKAELAGRVIGTDPERAATEIAELETVARQSLTEVRQAVTSYRQPSLAAELVSSRRILASAGIDCQLKVPSAYSLPPAVDALLAWTVREGATNIVRHSAARHAEIVIELTDAVASARLSDDGAGPRGKDLRTIAGALAGSSAARGGRPAEGYAVGAGDGAAGGFGAEAAGGDGAAKARAPGGEAAAGASAAGGDGAARGAGAAGSRGAARGDGAAGSDGAVGSDGAARGDGAARSGGAVGAAAAGGGPAGSGLAGLAERAARLGGTLSAGAGEDGGFWLRVSVPLAGLPTGGTAVDPGPGKERMPS